MAGGAQTLILARHGPLRDALKTLLASIPGIVVLAEASVAAWPRAAAAAAPDLVLMDAGLYGGDEWVTARQVRDTWPRARLVILTDDDALDGESAEADVVLMRGTPAARLVGVLERILASAREEGEHSGGGQTQAKEKEPTEASSACGPGCSNWKTRG